MFFRSEPRLTLCWMSQSISESRHYDHFSKRYKQGESTLQQAPVEDALPVGAMTPGVTVMVRCRSGSNLSSSSD